MKIYLCILLSLLTITTHCASTRKTTESKMVNFRLANSVDEIKSTLKKENKIGILYFNSCGWADTMNYYIFSNPEIRKYIESHFVSFVSNVDTPRVTRFDGELDKYYDVQSCPSVYVVDSDGDRVASGFFGYYYDEEYLNSIKKKYQFAMDLIKMKKEYKSNPGNLKNTISYANKLMELYRYQDAMPLYEELSKKVTDKTIRMEIYDNLLTTYQKLSYNLVKHNLNNAITILEEGLKNGYFGKRESDVHAVLGCMNFWKKDYPAAIKYLEKVPDDYVYLYFVFKSYLSISYYKTGQNEKGAAFFEKQFSEDFKYGSYLSMSFVARICDEYNVYVNQAISWMEKAIQKNKKDDVDMLTAYAQLLAKTDSIEKAIINYEKVIKIKRDLLTTDERCRIAALHFRKGEKIRAGEMLKNLCDHSKKIHQDLWLLNIAWICYRNNLMIDETQDCIRAAFKILGKETIIEKDFDYNSIFDEYTRLLFEENEITKALEVFMCLTQKSGA